MKYARIKVKGFSRFKGHRNHQMNSCFRKADDPARQASWGRIKLVREQLVDGELVVTLTYPVGYFHPYPERAEAQGLEIL